MNIVIVDDHQIIIDGLQLLLSLEKQYTVLATYTNPVEFLDDLEQNKMNPDIILLDLMMPVLNGVEVAKMVKKKNPQIKILILSMNCEGKVIAELIDEIGVNGYVSKKMSRVELATALKDVAYGYLHLSSEADAELIRFRKKLIQHADIKLSSREKEIIHCMIGGLTNKEIASQLFISESTVETHRKNIYRKTDVHSLPKLIALVNELDLLNF